jgi:hypothetical protein
MLKCEIDFKSCPISKQKLELELEKKIYCTHFAGLSKMLTQGFFVYNLAHK